MVKVSSERVGGVEDQTQTQQAQQYVDPAMNQAQYQQQQPVDNFAANLNSFNNVNQQSQQHQHQPQYNNTVATGNVPQINIFDIQRRFNTGAIMGQGGATYVKQLKELLIDENVEGRTFQFVPLTQPPSSIGVVCGQDAIILLFEESINHTVADIPVASHIRPAVDALMDQIGPFNLVDYVVVTPHDYNRPDGTSFANAQATSMMNKFRAYMYKDAREMNINYFKNANIDVSYNSAKFDKFQSIYFPHGVPSRADIKMTIMVSNNQNNQNITVNNMLDKHSQYATDIGTIGAYVNIIEAVDPTTRTVKYQPLIYLEYTASVPVINLAFLFSAIAKAHLIDGGNWTLPYRSFKRDSPNIGNLLNNADGSPFYVENTEVLNNLIGEYFHKPCLMLSITEGRSRMPGIEAFSVNEGNEALINSLRTFIPNIQLNEGTNIASLSHLELTGNIRIGTTVQSSDHADYLNLMLNYGSRKDELREFLHVRSNPSDKVNIIRKYFPDFEVLYSKSVVLLDPNVINTIQSYIEMSRVNITSVVQHQGTVDPSRYVASGQQYANGQINGQMIGMANPFRRIYGDGQPYRFNY